MLHLVLHLVGYILFFGGLGVGTLWSAGTAYLGIRYGELPRVVPVWPLLAIVGGVLLLGT